MGPRAGTTKENPISILRNYGGHRPELVFRDDAMAGAAAANPEALWKLENLGETHR